jgi:hypothetical protein
MCDYVEVELRCGDIVWCAIADLRSSGSLLGHENVCPPSGAAGEDTQKMRAHPTAREQGMLVLLLVAQSSRAWASPLCWPFTSTIISLNMHSDSLW